MLDVTLQLTRAERAYVFLKDEEGKLRLAAGRNAKKEPLLDDKTISHSILEESMRANSEFLLTDTSQSLDMAGRQSIVAYDLRTVVCIPLRKMQVQATRDAQTPLPGANAAQAMGVLYVDSRFASRDISGVGHDILHAIATEAASLIENARLVQAEEEARRYQQELGIAASIQQRLMQVKIPEVPFAQLRGKNLSCKEIGGDFFDAVNTKEGLAVVLADVSGKGVSAALLASTLQGMIYSHLSAGMPLLDVVSAVNRFFTDKLVGEKYATVLLVRLKRDGELEYVNCGHVPPLLVCGGEVIRPPHGNVPVGLLPDATFESSTCQMQSGDRFILVTDGVTEAENAMGDFFEDFRLEAAAAKSPTLEGIFSAVTEFCCGKSVERRLHSRRALLYKSCRVDKSFSTTKSTKLHEGKPSRSISSSCCTSSAPLTFLDRYAVIRAFPTVLIGPEKCEDHLASNRQRRGGQIEDVDSNPGITRVGIMSGLPVVDTPVHAGRIEKIQAQRLVAGNRAWLVVETPAKMLSPMFFDDVALVGLRGLIEDLAIANRSAQLDVFGVRPDERTSGARGLAAEKFQRWKVGCIPNLFGK